MRNSLLFKDFDFSTPAFIPYYGECSHIALNHARTLGKLGVPVFGAGNLQGLPAEFSRYIRKVFFLEPLRMGNEQQILNSLIKISRILGRKPVILIMPDELAKFAAKFRDTVYEHFIMPRLDLNLVESLCDKKRTYFMALQNGVPTVKSEFPESVGDVLKFSYGTLFPVTMKATDWSNPKRRPPIKMNVLKSPCELIEEYDKVSSDVKCPKVILQEYIHGAGSQEWIFHGYFNEQSKCLFACTGRKLRQWPIFGGITTLGLCSNNETVESMSINFLQAIGYSGLVDIDYIFDPSDDLYKVLDVNPRIGANFRLFEGKNGLDEVIALYLDLTGQPVPADSPVEGRKWIVEDLDFFSARASYRQGALELSDWARSLRGIKEGAWFALDDPLPFFKHGFRILRKKIKGIIRS